MADKEHALHTCEDLTFMYRRPGLCLTDCERLTLQEQLHPRKYGQFGDLANPDALRKLCRVFCEKRAILELQISNRCERRWCGYRGSSRIGLWYGWSPGLCLAELSKGAQLAKQVNHNNLQSPSSESHKANLFPKQMRHVPARICCYSQ